MAKEGKKNQDQNEVVSELKQRNVTQQFANDTVVLKEYMDRDPQTDSINILRRTMLMLEQAKLSYRNEGQSEFTSVATTNQNMSEDKPQFTEAAILSHGGRIMMEFSVKNGEDPNKPLNWLLTGDANTKAKVAKNRDAAEEAGTTFYRRSFASHHVTAEGEKLLKPKDPRHWGSLLADSLKGKHYGVDLGLGGPEDGAHGHLYVYWDGKNMLVSIENSAPGVTSQFGSHHGASAKSSDVTPTGGLKFRDPQFNDYPIRPAREDGMHAQPFSSQEAEALYQKSAADFSTANLNRPVRASATNSSTKDMFMTMTRGRVGERLESGVDEVKVEADTPTSTTTTTTTPEVEQKQEMESEETQQNQVKP